MLESLTRIHFAGQTQRPPMTEDITLSRVYATEIDTLQGYIEDLYEHDDHFDSMIHIEEGVLSLMKNESLAMAYFIKEKETKIGYVILNRYHSVSRGGLTIFIDELYVAPQNRRKHIGTTTFELIKEIAKKEGAKSLWVQTRPFNEAAQTFFKKMGFEPHEKKSFEHILG